MEGSEIRGLTRRYGDMTAVDDLNLTVHVGECLALLGVNGAGKTTTIRMLACLTKPTAGDAKLLGHSIVTKPQAVKAEIALSPQETAVAPNLTVRENLELIAGICGHGRKEAARQAGEMIAEFRLGEVEKKRAGKLSGGSSSKRSFSSKTIPASVVLDMTNCSVSSRIISHRRS